MSSLANQLSQIASLDAARLTSRGGHPSSKSYLFPPKVAASHDLDAIYSLAQSGFEELLGLDPDFEQFEDDLFSEKAKATDRMLYNQKENEDLDLVLNKCLRRLGRWVGVMAGGKCIEWLVRRFRVHEMNAEVLLQVFLPYHSSPNFPRILSILTLPTTSPYHAPFAALVKHAQAIPRSYITTAVSPEREKSLRLLEDIAGLVRVALKEGVVHRALLGFWTGVLIEMLEKAKGGKGAGENLVKVLVETFVNLLETKGAGEDVNAAVYPPLILLTRTVRLADGPFLSLLSALLTPDSGANPSQRILTLLVILNDRRDWEGGLGDHAAGNLGKIGQLGQILRAAMEKFDFEAALKVILGVLVEAPELNQSHISQITDLSPLPTSLVKALVVKALAVGSASDVTPVAKAVCKTIITSLREKNPAIVEVASQASSVQIDYSLIERPAGEVALINAVSADLSARIEGINSLLSLLLLSGSSELPSDELESIRSTILARLRDTEIEVLQTLYQSAKHRDLIVSICGVDATVDALVPTFTSASLDGGGVLASHLEFVANHLSDTPASSRLVFQRLLFPVLLPSERRQLSNDGWKILKNSKIASYELLKGSLAKNAVDAQNTKVLSAKLADAIGSSKEYELHTAFILSQLDSEVAASKILAQLVLTDLIQSVKGDKRVELGVKVLDSLRPSLLAGQLQGSHEANLDLSNEIRLHLDSKKTSHKVSQALLAALAHVPKPSKQSIDWLSEGTSSYKTFATSLYIWSNSSTIPDTLSKTLFRSLLTQLGEDALLFLASIWTSSLPSSLRVSALRHASAFVNAYTGSDGQNGTDFQLIVPALLLALSDGEQNVRLEATKVLNRLASSVNASSGDVYALDTIYGSHSNSVQLLKQADLARYLQTLTAISNEYIVDASRIRSIHAQKLTQQSNENKKDTRAVVGSLLSHAVAWRSTHRIMLLNILAAVRESAVLRGILPLLLAIRSDADEQSWAESLPADKSAAYLDLLVNALTPASVGVLQEDEGKGWKWLKSTLSASTPLELSLRRLILTKVEKELFDVLSQHQKADFIRELLNSLEALSADTVLATKDVLSRLRLDTPVLIEVLGNLSHPLETASHRKKQRADESNEAEQVDKAEKAIQKLSTLIDSRTWSTVPGDAKLLSTLMSLLSTLLAKRQSIKEGIDYVEQEVLGAVLAVVEKISDPAEIVRAHVGIEVVIKVIRASTNPRTSQRALLVTAELARLIPEAVLHNIMPIFTFMGASDFQRDDAYSFGVVEKTVARIVPVMTKSLREKAASKLELYKESKTFISIFTDMASRLPKHRTLPFFTHLVKSLGAEDYLAPICMLLVERSTSKAARGGISANQAMELPQGVVASFEIDIKLEVALETILEVLRLVEDLGRSDEEREAFLAGPMAEADKTFRHLTALLTFTTNLAKTLAGQQCDQSVAEEIVKRLLILASVVSTSSVSSSGAPAAVQNCLGACMSLLSAAKFLSVVKTLLSGENEQNIIVALNILVERLPRVRPEVRIQNAVPVSQILKLASALVQPSSKINTPALSAVHAIVSTAQKSEDGALAETVGTLVAVVPKLEASDQISTLSILDIATRHLVSRAIPYIQPIIETTLKLISSSSSTAIARQAFALQSALFDVVPTFIASKQLIALLRTAVGYGKEDLGRSVISAASKKVPTKTLFPVVMDLWKSIQSEGQTALLGFFDLLRLVLRNADRKALPTLVKPVFAFFLDVFDLRHRLRLKKVDDEVINAIESSCIGSFLELVTKLNEATFKPLFIRLYDWAVVDLAEGKRIDDERLIERKIVLLHVMKGLLSKFKNLLSPYIGTLLPHIEELLQAFISGDVDHIPLWTLILEVLSRSFDVDDGAFWTDQSLTTIIPLLIAQLSVYPDIDSSSIDPAAMCLGSLAGSTTSENVLKSLNTDICMVTRDDNHRVRMAGLRALDAIWSKQPEELLQFVPETVSEFLVELLEDENSDVELLARNVLARIEKLTGSLKEYLE